MQQSGKSLKMLIAHQNKKVSWEDLYFLAESSKEAFREVYLITAKCTYVNAVEERVIDKLIKDKRFDTVDWSDWHSYIKQAIKTNVVNRRTRVNEYVDVQPTHITVCLNRDFIDDAFIATAIDRLSSALDTLNGECGRVIEPDNHVFDVNDIPWLNAH